jgi:hypothetical protein
MGMCLIAAFIFILFIFFNFRSGNVKWQNMMSTEASQWILEEIQPIFLFNGHDHDGCIYRHNDHTVEYAFVFCFVLLEATYLLCLGLLFAQ